MVVAIVLFIGVAIVKPWNFGLPNVGPAATQAADRHTPASSTEPSTSPEPSDPGERTLPDEATITASWFALEERHDWGIQVLAASAVANAVDGAWLPGLDLLVPFGNPVLAIGLTSPAIEPVLDLRIWGVSAIMRPDRSRVSVERIQTAPQRTAGYRYVDEASRSVAAWPPGHYDLEILTAAAITTGSFDIPGEAEPPAFTTQGPGPSSAALIERMDGLSDGLYIFTTSPGVPNSFEVTEVDASVVEGGDLPDALETWLNLPASDGSVDVAPVTGPRAGRLVTAVAYVLPPMAELRGHDFNVLGFPGDANVQRTLLVPRHGERHAGVIFIGGPHGFDPGLYRLMVRFADPVIGRKAWTVHLDLTPEQGATSDLLDAARTFGTFFESDTLLGGLPSAAGPVDTRDAPPISSLGGACRGGSRYDGAHPIIGVPVGLDGPADLIVQRVMFGGRTERIDIRLANLSHQGLVVFGHGTESAFPAGWYRASTGGADGITWSFCVGEVGPNGFRVPPGAGSPIEPTHHINHGRWRPEERWVNTP